MRLLRSVHAIEPVPGSPSAPEPMTLQLKFEPTHLKRLLWTLIGVELVIVAIYVVTALSPSPSQLGVLFNLDEEGNVPSWFSSMQLFTIGVILLVASSSPLRVRDRLRSFIMLLGAVFVFLSADEAAAIHEKVTSVVARLSWAPRFSGGHGIWMFVYVAIAIAAAAVLIRPIIQTCRTYPRDTLGVIAGVFVLGLGAVGIEAIGYELVGDNAARNVKTLQVGTEEFCEMLGASIILVSALRFALRESIPGESTTGAENFPLESPRVSKRTLRP
jgi:hypothetical protein